MRKAQLVLLGSLIILFFLSGKMAFAASQGGGGSAAPVVSRDLAPDRVDRMRPRIRPSIQPQLAQPMPSPRPPELQVTLSAAYRTSSWDERDPDRTKFDLPLLYLHHEREAAPEAQRTLDIAIVDLAGGGGMQMEAVSYHVDVTTGEQHRETKAIHLPDRPCVADYPCRVGWTFDPGTMLSDFYTLRLTDNGGDTLWESPQPDRPDFVILDTWDVALGYYGVRLYYATLFPFARGAKNSDSRLSPGGVVDFIEGQFVPIIRDAWRTQVEDWGFGDPIHADWDADGVIEVIITDPPFALFRGTGTYTVSRGSGGHTYPERRIWWCASFGQFLTYDTLVNAHKSIFAHEFFHLMQWNTLLPVERPGKRWNNLFFEAQANFAVTLQHPALEMGKDHVVGQQSEYTRAANRFLALRLNTSYRDLETDATHMYDAALYWRFLYEQFQDVGVIRAALEEMALGYDADIVGAMGDVMDRALARFDGPFHSFEESLVAFARANYALRLENGRCSSMDLAECIGLYFDPDRMYLTPRPEAERDFDGSQLTFRGSIPSSYGMDFIEVNLNHVSPGQALKVEFKGSGDVARFSVQVWGLRLGEAKMRAVAPEPEIVPQNPDGAHVYVVQSPAAAAYDALGLIITRLDADETIDPTGSYTITVGYQE